MQRIVRAERRGPRVVTRDEASARAKLIEARAELAVARLEIERVRHSARDEAREVALLAAQHLVQAELALKPERIAEILDSLLARVQRAERAVVRVHPDDMPALERFCTERELAHVALEADATLARGGCVVATPIGTLDASIETRIDALRRALQKVSR
jgi:flagellar assembly protein FliH